MDVTQIAVSGLSAAAKRIANAANNIVNIRTPGFIPGDARQSSLDSGGVIVDITPRNPATVAQATENGVENLPNISLEQEVVNSVVAANDYEANLALLKRKQEMDESLLDIQA